jgi:BirA family biotin operon repressor/biotin-[acetyl-CoA-carboxylase] ligase
MGRSFFSPDGSGIYMSVILKPDEDANHLRITTDAAVACARAIEKVSGKQTGIKWVNDIYIDGRKVCGILAEASLGENSFVILGIGVNVFCPENGFPDDIKMRAGYVFDKKTPFMREKIAVEILKELIKKSDKKSTVDEYRSRSIIVGKKIDIIKGNTMERGTVLAINDDYSLKVIKDDEKIENISSGDVSIRI